MSSIKTQTLQPTGERGEEESGRTIRPHIMTKDTVDVNGKNIKNYNYTSLASRTMSVRGKKRNALVK